MKVVVMYLEIIIISVAQCRTDISSVLAISETAM